MIPIPAGRLTFRWWSGSALLGLGGLLLGGCFLLPRDLDLPPEDTAIPVEGAYLRPGRVQVGTFNAEWLWEDYSGTFERRNAVDYSMIARMLRQWDLDLVGLQEIDGVGALDLLNLPAEYDYVVGTTGWSQNLAILYRSDLLSVSNVREVQLPSYAYPNKMPLVADVAALDGDLAFTFVVLHFKAFSDDDASAQRYQQVLEFHDWVAQELPSRSQPPYSERLVALGDWNDRFDAINDDWDSLQVFEDDQRFYFASLDTEEYTQIPYHSRIDHILLSSAMLKYYRQMGQPDGCWLISRSSCYMIWQRCCTLWSHGGRSVRYRDVWLG